MRANYGVPVVIISVKIDCIVIVYQVILIPAW